jgi:Mrp family chromosome partitioning ATPase
VKALRLSFDYVLIDTPPVLPTSDACFLARHADVSVLACAWLNTEITAVRESAERLSAPGLAPLVGLVLNMIEPSGYRTYAASYGERLPIEGRYLSYP